MINLLTLREESIDLASVSRISLDAIEYDTVELGYSPEAGIVLDYPHDAMRDEVVNMSKQERHSTQKASEEEAEVADSEVEGKSEKTELETVEDGRPLSSRAAEEQAEVVEEDAEAFEVVHAGDFMDADLEALFFKGRY